MIGSFIFVFVYIASTVLLYLGQSKKSVYYSIAALTMLVLILTFRATGTDTYIYSDFFNDIKAEDGAVTWNRIVYDGMEPLVVGLSFIGGRLGADFRLVLFVHAVITVILMYLASINISKKYGWIIFSVLTWTVLPLGFNTMRQIAALSLVYYASTILIKKREFSVYNFLVFMSVVVMGAMTHASSIFASAVVFIAYLYYILNKKIKLNVRSRYVLFCVLVCVSFAVSYFLINSDIIVQYLPRRYSDGMMYIDRGVYFSYSYAIMLMSYMAIVYVKKRWGKSIESVDRIGVFYFYITGVSLLASTPAWFSGYAGRLTDYFLPISIVALSLYLIPVIRIYFRYPEVVLLSGAVLYFLLNYVAVGNGEIFPFMIEIAGTKI